MAKLKVQGSRWWAFDGTTLIRLVCLKTFDPGSDSAGKIETTCLDDDETKTYIPGLHGGCNTIRPYHTGQCILSQ
ncbi:phage tail tube protein [Acinetobacter sp. ANC 5383]